MPGELWFHLEDQPRWYYKTSTDPVQLQAFISSVAAQVSESTKFAAMLFPLMIKGMALGAGFVAGFPATLAARLAAEIGAAAIDELATEGQADAAGGKPRTAAGIAKSMGVQVLLSLVLGRLFGGGGAKATTGELARFEIKAADNVRKAVAEIEGPEVAIAVRAGRARPVEDAALAGKGYVREVPIRSGGEAHVYRQHTDGTWCRFSKIGMCKIELKENGLEAAPKTAPPRAKTTGEPVEEGAGARVRLGEKSKTKPAKEAEEGRRGGGDARDREVVGAGGRPRTRGVARRSRGRRIRPYAWFTHARDAARRSAVVGTDAKPWMYELSQPHLKGRQVGWLGSDGSGWRLDWSPDKGVHINWQRVHDGVTYRGAILSGQGDEKVFLALLERHFGRPPTRSSSSA